MSELNRTLHGLGFEQLLLALVFLASYALALSGLTGERGRRRAALLALLAAIGFAARTDPWVHGALLMAFAVAGMGLFILAVWLVCSLFGFGGKPPPATATPAAPSLPIVRKAPDRSPGAQQGRT